MSEKKPKSIPDVLRSRRFQREVSLLLFVFAAANALFSVALLMVSGPDENAVPGAAVYALQAIIYAVLAFFIRRGRLRFAGDHLCRARVFYPARIRKSVGPYRLALCC